MGSTTTNLKLPYPALSDPANGPAGFQALAEALDKGSVVSGTAFPTAPGVGQRCVRTDLGNSIWEWDGTNWQQRQPLPAYAWKKATISAYGAAAWLNVPTEGGNAVVDAAVTSDPAGAYFNMLFVERRLMVLRAGLYHLNFGVSTSVANTIARIGRVPSSNAVHDLVLAQTGNSGGGVGTMGFNVIARLAANTAVSPALYNTQAMNDAADAALLPARFTVTRLSD